MACKTKILVLYGHGTNIITESLEELFGDSVEVIDYHSEQWKELSSPKQQITELTKLDGAVINSHSNPAKAGLILDGYNAVRREAKVENIPYAVASALYINDAVDEACVQKMRNFVRTLQARKKKAWTFGRFAMVERIAQLGAQPSAYDLHIPTGVLWDESYPVRFFSEAEALFTAFLLGLELSNEEMEIVRNLDWDLPPNIPKIVEQTLAECKKLSEQLKVALYEEV